MFSRTSLQAPYISSKTPRAIYFNDHTYVAWVKAASSAGSLDHRQSARARCSSAVHNASGKPFAVEREGFRCMACHDSAAHALGRLPKVQLLSSPIEGQVNPPLREGPVEVTHATAIEDRWGGWFVTGSLGSQLHVGNLPLAGAPDPTVRNIHNRSNLGGLQGYIDATPYSTDKSDIVALLTLEHQAYVQNLITSTRYEASTISEVADARRWSDLQPQQQAALQPFTRPTGHRDHVPRRAQAAATTCGEAPDSRPPSGHRGPQMPRAARCANPICAGAPIAIRSAT